MTAFVHGWLLIRLREWACRCPRCATYTDRTVERVCMGYPPWSMTVRWHEGLICSACLASWAARPPLLIPPEVAPTRT